jgi:peptidyl-prolyl cis-trans isomerase C
MADDADEAARLGLPLAKINGDPLTIYYFEAAAARLAPEERLALSSETGKERFLHELVTERLQAEEAVRRGYDKHAAVQALLKKKLASMMEIVIGYPVREMVPSEDELRHYFEAHPSEFQTPEMMRARHMVFKDRKKAREVLQMLLVKKPSEERFLGGGKKGLDMGFFPRPEARTKGDLKTVPALAKAAFTLEKDGDIYPELISSRHGYHILMRTGHREAEHKTFEEVRQRGLVSAYKAALRDQKVEEGIEALKKRYPVVIHEEVLEEVRFDP